MQDKPIISPLGQPFIELESTDSTNNYALACIRKAGAAHGTAWFAHEQTAGKGQRGRKWVGEKEANIALSILIEPRPLLISRQFQLSACLAVAAHRFFSRYAGTDTKIKWPNDLYWQDRKAGGMLIENIISGNPDPQNPATGVNNIPVATNRSVWKWAVAGIGININQTYFPADLPNPVSLKQITGRRHFPVLLAKEFCAVADDHFKRLIQHGFEAICEEYNHCLYKLNEPVKLRKDNRAFTTIIKGVSPMGQLITENNRLEVLYEFGEVTFDANLPGKEGN